MVEDLTKNSLLLWVVGVRVFCLFVCFKVSYSETLTTYRNIHLMIWNLQGIFLSKEKYFLPLPEGNRN